jgi:hypothetical protein
MTVAGRRYAVELVLALLAYAVVLPLSIFAYRTVDAVALRAAIALVPVVPAAFGIAAILRYIRTMDELEQHIHFEAVTFAFCTTGLLTFAYGLLENVDAPRVGFVWVLPATIVLWLIGQAIARRRY